MQSDDPISRLQIAQAEVDHVLGPNYAREHPELLVALLFGGDLGLRGAASRGRHRARRRRLGHRGGGAAREQHRAGARSNLAPMTRRETAREAEEKIRLGMVPTHVQL